MKKIYIILCLFFFKNMFSQQVFDIKVDLISTDKYNIKLYKKSSKNNLFRALEIEIQELYDFEYNFNISTFTTRDSLYIYNSNVSIIHVEKLPPLDIKNFKKDLKKRYFIKNSNTEITQLEYFNNSFFALNTYKYEKIYNYDKNISENQWVLNYTDFYHYVFLRLNNKKLIVLLFENNADSNGNGELDYIGSIIPFKKNYKIIIEGTEFKDIDSRNIDKTWLEASKNYLYEDSNKSLYRIENNKLKDVIFNIDLLSKKFDSLYIDKGYIIGKIKEKHQVYNSKLEDITPRKKIKAIHVFDSNYLQAIINTKIKWISKSAKITNKKEKTIYTVCGTVNYSTREITQKNTDFLLNTKNSLIDGNTNTVSYRLFSNTDYDNVYFLNGTKFLSFDGNTGTGAYYKLPNNALNYLIVKKNDKFGLLEVIFLKKGLKLKTILPINYDSIIYSGYYLPIKFEKNGLFGYYPINASAKYKKLEKFNYFFSRFTLPNNRKGWLSLEGKEYLD